MRGPDIDWSSCTTAACSREIRPLRAWYMSGPSRGTAPATLFLAGVLKQAQGVLSSGRAMHGFATAQVRRRRLT